MVFSTLAIEEAAKFSIILQIFLSPGVDKSRLWKEYRNHKAKTAWLNPAIESRIRATFPRISREDEKRIRDLGPTPAELDISKQRALYSETYESSGEFVSHLPRLSDWPTLAWDRLCEARALMLALRDHTPGELTVWLRHAEQVKGKDVAFHSFLDTLYRDLLKGGFVEEGSWDTLLEDAKEDSKLNQESVGLK
jgi:AbiV family abortive infection protein